MRQQTKRRFSNVQLPERFFPLGFQASDTNSGKLLFAGGAIVCRFENAGADAWIRFVLRAFSIIPRRRDHAERGGNEETEEGTIDAADRF